MTDPSPEGVGCVAPAALEKVLTAAVGNHVLVQRGVPVTVVRHAATAPLVEEENIFLKNNDQVLLTWVVYLSLDGVPCILQASVIVCGVQHQPFF